MKVRNLTDPKVASLRKRKQKYDVFEENGFGVRVGASGVKSWFFFYRDKEGKQRRYTFGRFPDMTADEAREEFARRRREVSGGGDPAAERKRWREEQASAPTFAEMADDYLERHSKRNKRSWRTDERYIERHLKPAFEEVKARDVTRRAVIDLVEDIAEETPVQANRVLGLLRSVYNWAIERDIVDASPCDRVKAPTRERPRDRVLSEDEIRTLWRALVNVRPPGESFDPDRYSPMGEATSLALRVQLLTAQRIGEVVGAPWSEFDLDSGWWTIAADRSKNRLPHRVPLTQPVLELLERARELGDGSAYLFPGKARRFSKPERQRDEPIRYGVCDYALRRTRERYGLERFTPHDLRRTAASYMTGAGVSRLVVAKVLNHAERGITAVYDRHGYDREKRDALAAWSRELDRIVANGKRGSE